MSDAWKAVWLAMLAAIVCFVLVATYVASINCAARDGKLVRGLFWFQCVEARR